MSLTWILPIILVVVVINLHSRLRKLEKRLAEGAPRIPSLQEASAVNAPATSLVEKTYSDSTPPSGGFVAWLTEDWLMKLGALLLLIGFGWLATYAFLHNWIGPMGRILLGVVCGALFIVLGWWRIKKYLHQGGIFLVVGSTTILLTLFAARELYDFFTPAVALAVMFLSTVFVAVASVVYKSRALALSSLVLAGIAPLLVNSPHADYIQLFAYLMVVVLGAIWVVAVSGMRDITFAALLLVAFYSLPHLAPSADRDTLLLFAYVFSAIFFITNTVSLLKLKDTVWHDLVTAAGNGIFLLMWILYAVPQEWQSLNMVLWMLIFTIGAFVLYQMTGRREPLYVYAGVGIAMLGAATSAELHGATLTIAFTLESGVIALIANALLGDARVARRLCALFIVPIVFSVTSIQSSAWLGGILHKDFFVLFTISVVLLALGSYFIQLMKMSDDREGGGVNAALLIMGSLYAFILLWLSLHAALHDDDVAVMIALVVYTIVGIVAYFYALGTERRTLMLYGGCVLGFVVLRLLAVDVWKMEITGKIITFFLIGALLISTAFLSRKKATQTVTDHA